MLNGEDCHLTLGIFEYCDVYVMFINKNLIFKQYLLAYKINNILYDTNKNHKVFVAKNNIEKTSNDNFSFSSI